MNISRIDVGRSYGVKGVGSPRLGPEAAEGTQGDSLSLSPTAEHLGVARAALSDIPDVRMDRVAALKQKIQGGTYELSPRATAEGIVRHALESSAAQAAPPARPAED